MVPLWTEPKHLADARVKRVLECVTKILNHENVMFEEAYRHVYHLVVNNNSHFLGPVLRYVVTEFERYALCNVQARPVRTANMLKDIFMYAERTCTQHALTKELDAVTQMVAGHRDRCMSRCEHIKQELIAVTWHPKRMLAWCREYDDEFFDAVVSCN